MCFSLSGNKSSHVKLHEENAILCMLSNVDGKCNEPVRDKQLQKAYSPISLTPSGIYKDPVKKLQSLNAQPDIPQSLSYGAQYKI